MDDDDTKRVSIKLKVNLKRTLDKSLKESANHFRSSSAVVNKLALCDASLRQNSVRTLGSIDTLAASNAVTLLDRQTNCFLAKKRKERKRTGQINRLFLAH